MTVVDNDGGGSTSNANNFAGAPDGSYLRLDDHDTNDNQITVSVALAPVTSLQRDFILWAGTQSGGGTITVVSITLTESLGSGGSAVTYTPGTAWTVNFGSGSRPTRLTGSGTISSYSTDTDFASFDFSQIARLRINLSTTANNSDYRLDAIGNPEPGAIAMFGLGAAALCAAVLRRRRNAKKSPG